MGIAMKRCVVYFLQKELAEVRDELVKEKEQYQARSAAADRTIGSLQVLGLHVCKCLYMYAYMFACTYVGTYSMLSLVHISSHQ